MNSGMYSSNRDDWSTPQDFFDKLNEKFNFTLDVCANEKNHKCKRYFTIEEDGLSQDWNGEICWMNPPYGRDIIQWVEKAYIETHYGLTTVVVGLLPARTDTKWFHEFVYHKAELIFVRGRLSFDGVGSAPFPSMIAVWK